MSTEILDVVEVLSANKKWFQKCWIAPQKDKGVKNRIIFTELDLKWYKDHIDRISQHLIMTTALPQFGQSLIIHNWDERVPSSAENPSSALPDTSIPSSHLSRRRKIETHSDARNPLTPTDCNNLFSSLHSLILNTFLQKQIYGNPPVAYPLLLSNPHEGSQTCFFFPFCIRKYGSTAALYSVIITSGTLSFSYFTALFNVDFGLPYHCSDFEVHIIQHSLDPMLKFLIVQRWTHANLLWCSRDVCTYVELRQWTMVYATVRS